MRSKWFFLLVATLATASLWGCGSNGGSGGSAVTSPDSPNVQTVGVGNCVQCHANQNADWLKGRHANIETDDSHSASPSPSLHVEGSSCQPCHNETLDAVNMPTAFNVSIRDVVACESCHGGGSAHRGIGPIPAPIPGVDACAKCHAEVDAATGETIALRSRSGHSPAATTAVTDYLVSGHAGDPRDRSTRSDDIGCNRCHSDEGTKLYRGLDTVAAITATNGRGAEPLGLENITPIQCRTCHDVHETGGNKLLLAATADASAQYNTCNHCHAGDNAALNYHAGHADANGLLDRELTDTHYDDPATGYGLASDLIEGYVIRKQADTACSDCHNVHSGDNTINFQWANSAHGGFILQEKIDAVAAGGDPTASGPNGDDSSWPHYDWDAARHASCQRCHTATGAANFMSDPTGYVAANNDFSHIAGGQNEMLYCWGCHDNTAAGTLRDPGATTLLTTGGTPVTYNGEPVVIADQGGSNVCLNCHGGAGNMDSSRNTRFVGHHAQAGGTIFADVVHMGLEYPGQNYAYDYFFTRGHGTIEDPCVTCHMGDEANHTFAIFEEDLAGNLTFPNKGYCDTCHTPGGAYEVTADKLHEEKAGYEETAALLQDSLDANAAYQAFVAINSSSTATNAEKAAALAALPDGVYRAMQNQKLPTEEPGGFAHNRYYVKRLLFDSLDWMDNGVLDGEITLSAAAQSAYPEAALWLRVDAATGVATRPGGN